MIGIIVATLIAGAATYAAAVAGIGSLMILGAYGDVILVSLAVGVLINWLIKRRKK